MSISSAIAAAYDGVVNSTADVIAQDYYGVNAPNASQVSTGPAVSNYLATAAKPVENAAVDVYNMGANAAGAVAAGVENTISSIGSGVKSVVGGVQSDFQLLMFVALAVVALFIIRPEAIAKIPL